MNKTTKITLIAIAVIILWFIGYKVLASSETKEPVRTEQDLFLDKWTQVWVYKFKADQHSKKSKEEYELYLQAKDYKDTLLSELNWTGDSWKLSQ